MNQFQTWKSKDGYLWFAMWSNKYRDRDYPPEILSQAAHLDFVKSVNDGLWPYPELWLYHIPGSAFGDATYVDYDEVNGIAIAGGTIRPGMEAVAEALNSSPAKLLVSHGMDRKETRRDDDDPTVLTRFRSREFSPLPDYAAANELTGFVIGGNMEIQKTVKERIAAIFGAKAEEIAELLDVTGTEAKELDLESKSQEDEEVKTDTEDKAKVEPKEEAKTPDPVDPPVKTDDKSDEHVARKEIEEAITRLSELVGSTNATMDTAVKSISESIQTLLTRVSALEDSDEKKIAELAATTTRASYTSLIDIVNGSSIGNKDTKVDGRSALARDVPKETVVKDSIVRTDNPMMGAAITDIIERGTGVFGQGGNDG